MDLFLIGQKLCPLLQSMRMGVELKKREATLTQEEGFMFFVGTLGDNGHVHNFFPTQKLQLKH